MPPIAIALIVATFLVVDTIVVGAVFHFAINLGWNALADRYPLRPGAEGLARREFQSISIDMSNFGHSVHLAADETHLHAFPARVLRWLRARPMSIPWDDLALVSARARFGMIKAKLGTRDLRLPAWCEPLIRPDQVVPG